MALATPELAWPGLATVAALLLYFAVTANVGRARTKYQVPPPQMSGAPEFERALRVQANTLEQLPLFLPALWLFALFVSPLGSAILGLVWVVSRALYAWGYYQASKMRMVGFALGILSSLVMLLGSLVGLVLVLVKTSAA